MSKKHKHGGTKQGFDPFQRAQRELAKGNVKEALKEAKVCFRDAPTPERRRLLEQALAARAGQLQKAGLQDQAKDVFAELTRLGVTDPEVQAQLPRLQILLGLAEPGPAGDSAGVWESNPDLMIELADQAVSHPQRIPDKYVEMRRDCQRVRAALEAVERGDDAAAAEQLNDIARRSPFADWRLFVRGLSAFYTGDAERARANWDRLEPKRPAFRIAQTLLVHSGQLTPDKAVIDVANGLRRLEYAVQNDPVCGQLKEMGERAQANYWPGVFHVFRAFRQRFANSHGPLIERVTDLLWKRMVRDGGEHGLNRLVQMGPAPRLDPRWNRARALMAEQSQDESYETAEKWWKAYVQDLLSGDFLREDERRIAAGLVYQRLARQLVIQAHHEEASHPFPSFFDGGSYAEEYRAGAVGHYEDCLRLAPQLLTAHKELASLHLEMDRDGKAVKVYQSLLKHFPDDYETHRWLANYYLEDDKPDKAERYANEVQRLRPRDPATANLLWNQRVAMVRLCAKKRKFEMARREWESLAQQQPADTPPYWLDLLRAAVEYKANAVDVAEKYVAEAEAKLPDPTPVWMILHMQAARFGLNREVKNQFGARFKAAVAGACRADTAGQLARILLPFVSKQIKYTGLATHQRLVMDYLQRCQGQAWTRDDLWYVVQFVALSQSWRHRALRDRLIGTGMGCFPQDPSFPYLAGRVAMEDGPYSLDVDRTRGYFQLALTLNEKASQPLSDECVQTAKHALTLLDRAIEMRGRMSEWEEDEFDDEYDDEFGDEYDDEYDDDSESGAEFDVEELKRMAPPFLMDAFKRAAAQNGMSLPELLEGIASGELGPRDIFGPLESGGPAPPEWCHKRKHKSARRQ